MQFRRTGALLVLGAMVLTSLTAAHATSIMRGKRPDPLANPVSNTRPSRAFVRACASMSTSKKSNDACDAAAIKDFTDVRRREGLGPMTLPHDFDVLKVPAQLLAISNIERVDRGLAPMLGLSRAINARAQIGADTDDDPPFPARFVGDYESSNWADAGNSALLDDFYWMYDDGYGSFNGTCQTPTADGCWGHREDILGARTKPLLMGAAVTHQRGGASIAEQFIGDDLIDQVDVKPTWTRIAATTPVGVSASTVTVMTNSRRPGAKRLVVRSYSRGTVSARIRSGSAYWSVSPRSCHLAAGKTCTLTLHFHASRRGTHQGALRLTGIAGATTVTLIGRRVVS